MANRTNRRTRRKHQGSGAKLTHNSRISAIGNGIMRRALGEMPVLKKGYYMRRKIYSKVYRCCGDCHLAIFNPEGKGSFRCQNTGATMSYDDGTSIIHIKCPLPDAPLDTKEENGQIAQQTNAASVCGRTMQAQIAALLERAFDIAFTLPGNAELLGVIRKLRQLQHS